MEISKERDNSLLTVTVSGRIDTSTSPELEKDLNESLDGVENLILDFRNLEYISSAGLRILLTLSKRFMKGGSMTVRNVSEDVMEVFEMTGFSDILNIE